MGQEADQSGVPLIAPSSAMIPSTVSIVSPYKCFQSKQWWKNSVCLSLIFARHCVLPAALWLGALTTFLLPSIFMVTTFGKTVELIQLIQALVIYLFALFVGVPVLIWSLGAWLVRLTAYSAAFESFSQEQMLAANLDQVLVQAAQKNALEHAKKKKVFLTKFWSTLTLFLLVPCIILFVSMMVMACSSPAVLGAAAIKLPGWAVVLTTACCVVSGLASTVASFVGICVSANVDSDPVKQAKNTMALSIKYLIPLTFITGLSVLASVLISSPHELFEGGQSALAVGTLNVTWVSVAQELWRAVSSTVVLTATLAPICEYMRGKQIQDG